MGPYLRANLPKTRSVATELRAWLEKRPVNTRKHYLAYCQSWSEFLGVSFDDENALARWRKANHATVQAYLNLCADMPAQSGRSAEVDNKVSIATVKHRAVILKSCYDELIARGLIITNPFIRVVREFKKYRAGERRPHQAVPLADVKTLTQWKPKSVAEQRDHAIFNLLFGAALRRGEATSLRVGDVLLTDQGTTYLRLIHNKSQNVQRLALAPWCATIIKNFVKVRRAEGATDGDRLFVNYRADKYSPLDDQFIYRMFRKYCKRFGLSSSYTPHCARVTAITQALDQGLTHREVMELSRHSSVLMVERYDRKRLELDESAATKLRYK